VYPFRYFKAKLTFCASFRYPSLLMFISAITTFLSLYLIIAHNIHNWPLTIVVNGGKDIFSMLLSTIYKT
jgi:hypothetical protein